MDYDDEVEDHDELVHEIQLDDEDDDMQVEDELDLHSIEKLHDMVDEQYEYLIYPNFILVDDDEADDFIITHDIHDRDDDEVEWSLL